MVRYKKVRKQTTREVIETANCNKCKKDVFDENFGIVGHTFFVLNGYWMHHDGEEHRFDLCDSCYTKIIKSFKIEVTKTPYRFD